MITEIKAPPEHRMLPVDDIQLDETNPRIGKFTEMYGDDITEDQMYLALMADTGDETSSSSTTVEKLRTSIRVNDGIVTPIVVNEANGKRTCIEGNTRLYIYKTNKRQLPDDERWKTIPVLLHKNLTQAQIDAIRLQVHLVGTRPWEPYAKAKYLADLRNKKHLTWMQIVEFCGGRQREAEEQIQAYEEMELYYRPLVGDGIFDTSRFSGFVELQASGVKRAIAEAGFTLTDFARWLHEKKLRPLWHIRELPRILKHTEAKRVFLKSGSKDALKQLERPEITKSLQDANILQLARALSDRVQKVNIGELTTLRAMDGVAELIDARDAIRMLLSVLRSPDLLDDDDDVDG
jgi:hypothetical protein